jgi:aminopeptidase N
MGIMRIQRNRVQSSVAVLLALAGGLAGASATALAGGELAGAESRRGVLHGQHRDPCLQPSCGKAASILASFIDEELVSESNAGGIGAFELLDDTDVQRVTLDLELINPAANQNIAGTCTYELTVTGASINKFTVRLRSQFVVGTVLVNGVALPAANIAAPSATTREITLNRTYLQGEQLTIAIPYSGQAVSRGFGSIVFTFQNSVPVVATLSQPYFAYTWWPAKDGDFGLAGDNTDKFQWRLNLTTPNTLTGVSNGLLQGIDVVSGSRLRHRWASNLPMSTYLAAFAASSYVRTERTWNHPGGSMPVEFYLYTAQNTEANRNAWINPVMEGLDLFSSLYGPYPFASEKYGMYQFPQGGGMEHQTMTGQGTFDEDVTIHELAHQWWGDHLTCKSWSDIWLNEGFASYSEALWAERKTGSSGLPALKAAMAQRRPAANSGSVYIYDSSNANIIFAYSTTYAKSAWVLHMLRHVIGDVKFFETLLAWRAAYGGGVADTQDLVDVASSVSGQDLTTFFNQWVFGTGEVNYARGFDNITVNGRRYARFHIRQTQSTAYGSGGKFVMPLDVDLTTASGASRVRVNNSATTQWYVRPVSAAVTGVTVDPDQWVLVGAHTSETLLAGPPVVVQTVPAPGEALASSPAAVEVYFSANVSTNAGQYVLTGPGGAVPATWTYDSVAQRARLVPAQPLGPGLYTLTVADTVAAATGGQRLDGEVANPNSAAALPSGDGLPLGAATVGFSILPAACPSDYNGDGSNNLDDLSDFITDYYTVPAIPGGAQADAPTYAGVAVGFGVACPAAGDAPLPYDAAAYRTSGYRVGYSGDGSNECPVDAGQAFPNLDNLSEFVTLYYAVFGTPGC